MKKNEVKDNDSIAMYHRTHIKLLLTKLSHINEDASSSSDDDEVSYGGDDDDKRKRLVEAYSPSKDGQLIAFRETSVARLCTGREDSVLIKEFVDVLEVDFDRNNYWLLRNKIRELRVAFDMEEASYIMRAWNYSDSVCFVK